VTLDQDVGPAAAAGEDRPADPGATSDPGAGAAAPWYRPGLAGVAAAALAVRLVNVLLWRPTCDQDLVAVARQGGATGAFDPAGGQSGCFAIWGDTAYSYLQGRLIAEGHWFVDSFRWFTSGGTALHASSGDPPLFALYLAALARVGLTSGTAMRVATALVGVVGVALVATLVRRLAGPCAALIAGALAAVNPLLWINDGMLLSESLYVPVLAVALHAAYSFWERPAARSAAVLGATLALAALVRAEALILLSRPGGRERWLRPTGAPRCCRPSGGERWCSASWRWPWAARWWRPGWRSTWSASSTPPS
jgi:hypothetical protein